MRDVARTTRDDDRSDDDDRPQDGDRPQHRSQGTVESAPKRRVRATAIPLEISPNAFRALFTVPADTGEAVTFVAALAFTLAVMQLPK
jgi:hypothetical protein